MTGHRDPKPGLARASQQNAPSAAESKKWNLKLDVLEFDRLYIEANGGDGGDYFTDLKPLFTPFRLVSAAVECTRFKREHIGWLSCPLHRGGP